MHVTCSMFELEISQIPKNLVRNADSVFDKRELSYGSTFWYGGLEIFPKKGLRKNNLDTRKNVIIRGHRFELEVCL